MSRDRDLHFLPVSGEQTSWFPKQGAPRSGLELLTQCCVKAIAHPLVFTVLLVALTVIAFVVIPT